MAEKPCAHFAEEDPHDHIHLFYHGELFSPAQELAYDQCDEEYLDGDKGDVLEHVKEGVFYPVEDCYLYQVADR